VFSNTGQTTCSLRGFPGVSLVDASGEQVGSAASRTGTGGPAVVLVPGGGAVADLRMARGENYPAERCAPVDTEGLRVYPPDETRALFLPRDGFTGCRSLQVSLLSVKPLRPAP
jgi:hypothetical protein